MYLIHPMWFYLYGLVGNLSGLFIIFSIIFAIATFITVGIGVDQKRGSDDQKYFFKISKRFAYSFICFAALVTLTPSEKTMLQMAIASYATSENINKLAVNGKILKDELKTDFLEIIQSIKEDKKESKK